MAITHALAHAQPGVHTPPDELLNYLNKQLAQSYTRRGTFVTAFYAVLDPATRRLVYGRAGHNPPRLVRGDSVLSLDRNGAVPLGIVEEQTYRQSCITLEKGDRLLLYTDGITEAKSPPNGAEPQDMFGIERLDKLLLDCGNATARECLERIRTEVGQFSENAPLTDDQTLIALRCL